MPEVKDAPTIMGSLWRLGKKVVFVDMERGLLVYSFGETRWRSGLRREHVKINCQLTWVRAPPLLCLH